MIGLRELLLIGMVVLVLYGRSGVLQSRQARTILPWLSPVRRNAAGGRSASERPSAAIARGPSRIPGAFLVRGGRWFWLLAILAATAVAALIIGRTLIMGGQGHAPPLSP
jgi:hypothetical protein